MALVYSETAANALMNALGVLTDEAGSVKGYLDFLTSANARVVKCEFATDSFGAASLQGTPPSGSSIIAANTIAQGTVGSGAAGTIAKCRCCKPDDTVLWEGTVGVGTGDIQMPSVAMAVGEKLDVPSLNISMTVGYPTA